MLSKRAQDAPCFSDWDCPGGSTCDVRRGGGELWGCCCFFATPAPTVIGVTLPGITVTSASLINVVMVLPAICPMPLANCNPCPIKVTNCTMPVTTVYCRPDPCGTICYARYCIDILCTKQILCD
ncbi:unnamed protein product [Gordionus sp. m RMFG-2023]